MKNTRKSAPKQRKRTSGAFVKNDPRINRAGRPPLAKGMREVRELAQQIAEEMATLTVETGIGRKKKIMHGETIELILRRLAYSNDSAKQKLFMEYTYGKVPNVNVNQMNANFDFAKYADRFTDEELQLLKEGADPIEILISKIPKEEVLTDVSLLNAGNTQEETDEEAEDDEL